MSAEAMAFGTLPKVVAIVVFALLTVWFGRLTGQCFKDGPLSIIHLELAPTVAKANAFLEAWRTQSFPPDDRCPGNWKAKLQAGQAWDTWFICSYAPLLTLLCWVAAEHFAPGFPTVAAAVCPFGHIGNSPFRRNKSSPIFPEWTFAERSG